MHPWWWWRIRLWNSDVLHAEQHARLKFVGVILRGTTRYDPIGYVTADEWLAYILHGELRNTGLYRFVIP